jgi:hypothetical protein
VPQPRQSLDLAGFDGPCTHSLIRHRASFEPIRRAPD